MNKLKDELRRELGNNLLLLALYGSHARGEAQPDSDVDLFIVLRQTSGPLTRKVHELVYQLMWDVDFSYIISLYLIDMRHYATLERFNSSFLQNVRRDGKVLWQA